jgi:hypothetical protein
MEAKHKFYIQRDGDDRARRARETVWHNWDGELGECGDGIVERVKIDLPEIVKRGFDSLSKVTII